MVVTFDCCWDAIPIQKALEKDPEADLGRLYGQDVYMLLTHWREIRWRFEVILLKLIEQDGELYHKEVRLECSLLEKMTLHKGCSWLDTIIRQQCVEEFDGEEPYSMIIKAIGSLYVESPTDRIRRAFKRGSKTPRKAKKSR